jgi:hypothetical protein
MPEAAGDFLARAFISASVIPERAHFVRMRYQGSTERTAAALKHTGARVFGLQKSSSPKSLDQARSTMHTNPFFPFTAVSYPEAPRTITSALSEMDAGAALFAKAISALRSIRYCSTGAMVVG